MSSSVRPLGGLASPLQPVIFFITLVVGLTVLYPLLSLVGGLFIIDGRLSLAAFGAIVNDLPIGKTLLHTALYAGTTSILAVSIGAILAWTVERSDVGFGRLTAVIPLLPLLMPPLAGTIGWVFLLSPNVGYLNQILRFVLGSGDTSGPLNIFSFGGMVLVTTVYLVPYAFLAISAGFQNVDGSLDEAASVFGSGKLRTIFRISLPVIRPAILSAAALVLTAALAIFSVPAILGPSADMSILSVLIFQAATVFLPPRFDIAVGLSVMFLIVLQPMILLQRAAAQQSRYQTVGGKSARSAPVPLGRWRPLARGLILAYLVLATLPLIGLILVSLQQFWGMSINWSRLSLSNFSYIFSPSQQTGRALMYSAMLALIGSLGGMTIALLLSYQAQQRGGAFARVVDFVSNLPASVPHIVMGLAFLTAFSRPPINLYGTTTILLLAYICIYLPEATQTARFAFTQISRELSEAARVSGASESRTLIFIQLPLALPSAIAGALIIAVHMLSEVNASVLLMSFGNPVVGPTLFNLWEQGTVPPVAALSIVIVAVNTVIVIVAKRVGRMFSLRRPT